LGFLVGYILWAGNLFVVGCVILSSSLGFVVWSCGDISVFVFVFVFGVFSCGLGSWVLRLLSMAGGFGWFYFWVAFGWVFCAWWRALAVGLFGKFGVGVCLDDVVCVGWCGVV